jgi:phosphoribosylformylglycinamidine cyclo-ligase
MIEAQQHSAYARAGVDIEAGNQAVELIKVAVKATYTPEVLSETGAFGGLFSAEGLKSMKSPVLVATTDGVGTKVTLAVQTGHYAGIGSDIVNHCINDILVQGARPLFFLDYVASSKLNPEMIAAVVRGMAKACQEAGCALIGGETAEMPGVYREGHFDVVGTMVGVLDKAHMLPSSGIKPGDLLLGISSSGPHTNGYSLIRKVFAGVPMDKIFPEIGQPLSEVLLATHRSYLPILLPLITQSESPIKALAHLTGGGFYDNIPRVLPKTLGAQINLKTWPVPPLYGVIQRYGKVDSSEMYRVFNMGIGMVAVIDPEDIRAVQEAIDEQTWIIGEVTEQQGVRFTKE